MDRLQPKDSAERLKVRVRRHSAAQLLRISVVVPANSTVSTEKRKGRIVVRVESPVADMGAVTND